MEKYGEESKQKLRKVGLDEVDAQDKKWREGLSSWQFD